MRPSRFAESCLAWLPAACATLASACGGAQVAPVPGPSHEATAPSADDFVPFEATGKAGPLCFSSGVLPSFAVRLDPGGRYATLTFGDLHDVGLDDEGAWSQPTAGTLALDSDRWVPGFDAGSIAVDRLEPPKLSATYGRLRDGWKTLLAAHPDPTFAPAAVKAIDPSVHVEDESVPRRDVEAALAQVDGRLASKTPNRVVAQVGTYRAVTWLTRSDDDPPSLSGAKAAIDDFLGKAEAKPWIAEGTSPFFTLVDAGRCKSKPTS